MARTAISTSAKRKAFKINVEPDLLELLNRMSVVFSAGLRTSVLTRAFIYGARQLGAFDGLLDAASMIHHPMPTAEMLSKSEKDRKHAVKVFLFHWSRLDAAIVNISQFTPFHISPSTYNSLHQLRVMIHRNVYFPPVANDVNTADISTFPEEHVTTSVDHMLWKLTDLKVRELDWKNLSDWFREQAVPMFAEHTNLTTGVQPKFKNYFPLQTLKSDRRYEYEFLVLLQASDVFFASDMINNEEKAELLNALDNIFENLSRASRRWLGWNEDISSRKPNQKRPKKK